MKKTILTLFIIGGGISFANYVVFVDKDISNYTYEGDYIQYSSSTNWENIGDVKNCNSSPLAEDYYNAITFTQTEICYQEQEREITTYNKNIETNEVTIVSIQVENKTVEIKTDNDIFGTFSAASCLDIYEHYGNNGDGRYIIQLNGVNETVYCDMANGGWTLLVSTGNDIALTYLTTHNVNKNNPPSNIDHTLYDYFPKIDDFSINFSTNTIFKFSCKDKTYGDEFDYFHTNISNYYSYFNMSQGAYSGSIACASDEGFTMNSSNSLNDCLTYNDSIHRYYSDTRHNGGWSHFAAGNPAMLRHCGDYWIGDGANNQSQGYIWFK